MDRIFNNPIPQPRPAPPAAMSFNDYGRMPLRSNVDVQLQTAFSDGNWNAVIRLADKRFKSLKDPYYEVPEPPPSALAPPHN